MPTRPHAVIPREWYVLVHQLPPTPLYLRAKIRNRLIRVGAVGLKNSVYVLPAREDCLEDFQWIAGEAAAGGGSAYVCRGEFVTGVTADALVSAFRSQVDAALAPIAKAAAALLARARGGKDDDETGAAARRLRKKFDQAVSVDFFGSTKAREVTAMLRALEPRPSAAPGSPKGDFIGRTWVTRRGPKSDRMASGWLIRRFIDPAASFRFMDPDREKRRAGELTFDMVGGDFTHEADRCTFETLLAKFGLSGDAGLKAIGEIIHDIDLKEDRFNRPDTAGVRRLIDGIVTAHAADEARMERGTALFDDLYASFTGSNPASLKSRRTSTRRPTARSARHQKRS
jgi:hypothetical protein